MTKVLYDGDFVEQLEHFPEISFNLTTSRGKPTLEQTKRNIARAELLTSLAAYLSAVLDGTGVNAYRTADGVALEISHDGVYAAEQAAGLGETTNGTVVITLSATMESLVCHSDVIFPCAVCEVVLRESPVSTSSDEPSSIYIYMEDLVDLLGVHLAYTHIEVSSVGFRSVDLERE